MRALLVLAALVAVAGTASAVVLLEDPKGDAVEAKAATLCGGSPTAPACPAAATATPAPPDRDVIGAEASVDAEGVTFRILVAEAADSILGPAGNVSLHYMACFDVDVCVMGERTQAGFVGGFLFRRDREACGPGGVCYASAPMSVETGSPGAVAIRVPLEALPEGWSPASAEVSVGESQDPAGDRRWDGPAGLMPVGAVFAEVDHGRGVPERFPAFERPPLRRTATVAVEDATGEAPAHLDLAGVRWEETADSIVLEIEFADLEPVEGVHYGTAVALATSTRLTAVASVAHGEFEGRAALCRVEGEDTCAGTVSLDVGFEADGETLRWTLPRAPLGMPPAGTPVVMGYMWTRELARQSAGQLGSIDSHGAFDFAFLPPFALVLDTATPTVASHKATVVDDLHDVSALPLADLASVDALDLTFVEAEGATDSESRVVLGVHDAANIEVPPGYDALVYAVAFETDAGAFMIGLYHSDLTQEFFCAQDTLVFVEERADPLLVARQAITGAVSTASDRTAPGEEAGEGAGGSITFYVPHACFAQAGGRVVARQAAAGVYLVQNPTGRGATEIAVADDVAYPGEVVLEAASVVAAPTPWYANPFGIDSFYDIAGIVLAVLLSLFGLVAVQRRRSRLARYLRDVEQASAIERPSAREAALRGITGRLKSDLTRGRLAESHYVIVERRIDEAMRSARSASIRSAFADLPLALVETLQTLLADGDMSSHDQRVFLTQLEATRLTADAKAEVRERVRVWVAEEHAAAD